MRGILDVDTLCGGFMEKKSRLVIKEGRNPKKQRKVIRKKGKRVYMVLGEDFRVEQIMGSMGKALIGKFYGGNIVVNSLT
jgi:hypothetical protein